MKKIVFALLVIIFAASACSKKTAPAASTVNAKDIFANNCARCHGPTGTEGRAPNLAKSTMDKNAIVHQVTNGKDHMPAFNDKLTPQEISAIADWVVSLRKG